MSIPLLDSMMNGPSLANPERRLLKVMQSQERSLAWTIRGIMTACGWSDQAKAAGAALGLVEAGYAQIEESSETRWSLGAEGKKALEGGLLGGSFEVRRQRVDHHVAN